MRWSLLQEEKFESWLLLISVRPFLFTVYVYWYNYDIFTVEGRLEQSIWNKSASNHSSLGFGSRYKCRWFGAQFRDNRSDNCGRTQKRQQAQPYRCWVDALHWPINSGQNCLRTSLYQTATRRLDQPLCWQSSENASKISGSRISRWSSNLFLPCW